MSDDKAEAFNVYVGPLYLSLIFIQSQSIIVTVGEKLIKAASS